MSVTLQRCSPAHVIRCLLPQPYGTYILRYCEENDEIIAKIRIGNSTKENNFRRRYIILSIRVDEIEYFDYIKDYLLPYISDDKQENYKLLSKVYNKERITRANGKFTPLRKELIVPEENRNCPFDNRYLPDVDFTLLAAINTGKHNRGISRATWQCPKQNPIKVFIKRFPKNDLYFHQEFSLLKDLCHFPIIKLYGQYSDSNFSYLVFEDGGKTLESCCPLSNRTENEKMRFIASVGVQVAQAMMYLGKNNIVHRDLTASNVLINSYGFIRVADFGHATKQEEGKNNLERTTTKGGAGAFQYRFLPPECLPVVKLSDASNTLAKSIEPPSYASFSSKSDVWSFGILLIQLMIEDPKKPYPDIKNTNDIPQYVRLERHIHPRPKECPHDMYLILQQCWVYVPIDRISFEELQQKMINLETIYR